MRFEAVHFGLDDRGIDDGAAGKMRQAEVFVILPFLQVLQACSIMLGGHTKVPVHQNVSCLE